MQAEDGHEGRHQVQRSGGQEDGVPLSPVKEARQGADHGVEAVGRREAEEPVRPGAGDALAYQQEDHGAHGQRQQEQEPGRPAAEDAHGEAHPRAEDQGGDDAETVGRYDGGELGPAVQLPQGGEAGSVLGGVLAGETLGVELVGIHGAVHGVSLLCLDEPMIPEAAGKGKDTEGGMCPSWGRRGKEQGRWPPAPAMAGEKVRSGEVLHEGECAAVLLFESSIARDRGEVYGALHLPLRKGSAPEYFIADRRNGRKRGCYASAWQKSAARRGCPYRRNDRLGRVPLRHERERPDDGRQRETAEEER